MSSIERYANQQILDLVAYVPGKPIDETARELGMQAEDIVKLASNENPMGPSPKAVEAMQKAAMAANIYPDGASFRLRTAVAKLNHVAFDETIIGSGSSEVIELLCHSFLNKDAEVIAAKHAFSMYPIMAKLFGAKYIEVDNKADWTHDLQGFLDAITERTRLIFITIPTNPIGTVVSQEEVDHFMAKVPDSVVVCFDEAYHEFADNPPDTIKFVREGRNVAVLRTFSKVYGLAGLRVGYGLAPERICTLLHKSRTPFNANVMAQEAALAALGDEEHLKRTIDNNKREMKRYERAFQEMGLEWIPSQGNFVLVKVGVGREIFDAMLRQGVIVRPQGSYHLPEWIRISIGTPAENDRCLSVFRDVMETVKAKAKA
ncbi:MAG: histidinol-phosphate transaminase [Akkermansia sp.]